MNGQNFKYESYMTKYVFILEVTFMSNKNEKQYL